MSIRSEFIKKVKRSAARMDPYVWGGQGEKLQKMSLIDLSKMETSADNLNKVAAYVFNKVNCGVDMSKCKIFDCSGLPTYYLGVLGVLSYDTTAQGLYDICKKAGCIIKMSEAKPGDLVFRGENDKNIVHVGTYIGNMQVVEAKGRKYGVVTSDFSEGSWGYCGDILKALKAE